MRLLLLAATAALAAVTPARVGGRGTVTWTFVVLDGRTLYRPSPLRPGWFDAAQVHQSFRISVDATGDLKNTMGPAGQSEFGTDDDVAGKDFPGHDRIRLVETSAGTELEVDFSTENRDGSAMEGVAARYALPAARFGEGWAVAAADARRHFEEQARMQARANLGHLKADGWRVDSLLTSVVVPKAEHGVRLAREADGWRFLTATPYVLKVRAKLSR